MLQDFRKILGMPSRLLKRGEQTPSSKMTRKLAGTLPERQELSSFRLGGHG